MVFLDTCVWVELTGARVPIKEQEKFQAREASKLLKLLLDTGETIVTFREQLIEIVSAIIKANFNQYNRKAKSEKLRGYEDIKKFRTGQPEAYRDGIELCKIALRDIVRSKAVILSADGYSCDIDAIVKQAYLADVNDCLYYSVCKEKSFELYTFDQDFLNFNDNSGIVHWMHDSGAQGG